jgi:beta-N-acetylhexosaminidase
MNRKEDVFVGGSRKNRKKIIIYFMAALLVVCLVFLVLAVSEVFTGNETTDENDIADEETLNVNYNEQEQQEELQEDQQNEQQEESQEEEALSIEDELALERERREREVDEIIENMPLEDKVSQLFFVRSGDVGFGLPVGGVILFSDDIVNEEQLRSLNATLQEQNPYPLFIGVDEEGGPRVARVANSAIWVPSFPDMLEIGDSGDVTRAFQVGDTIGEYLRGLGFNVNFAPVADVFSNPANTVIGARAFGREADVVSEMVVEVIRGLQGQGVSATIKHFPGHGDTYEDSHYQLATSNRTLEELREVEFLPFIAGIEAGVAMVMMGHVAVPAITDDYAPASLSEIMLQGILRDELGFDGIVISDAMNMGAIVNNYGTGEAAVLFLQAGGDIILMPQNFQEAHQAVLDAVERGELSQERIDESLRRIFRVKLDIAQ